MDKELYDHMIHTVENLAYGLGQMKAIAESAAYTVMRFDLEAGEELLAKIREVEKEYESNRQA